MKTTLMVFGAGLLASSSATWAGAGQSWAGTWHDDKGGIISIREQDGFLDIAGKDRASVYSCTCLVGSDGVAQCIGEGMNHIEDFRFLYRSKVTRDGSGTLFEEWQADFRNGTKRGSARFTAGNAGTR